MNEDLERAVSSLKKQNGSADIRIRCAETLLEFPVISAGWISRGGWDIDRNYPPYTDTAPPKFGIWTSSLGYEPLDGDGPAVMLEHAEPFSGLLQSVSEATEPEGIDDRYALEHARALLHLDYDRNRDLLLGGFDSCVAAGKQNPPECGSQLGVYLINLYWRGDSSLLEPMMRAAADDVEVLSDMGDFYAELMSRQPKIAVSELQQLPQATRETVCRQAGEDGFWSMPEAEVEKASESINALGDFGKRCWAIASEGAKHPYGR